MVVVLVHNILGDRVYVVVFLVHEPGRWCVMFDGIVAIPDTVKRW